MLSIGWSTSLTLTKGRPYTNFYTPQLRSYSDVPIQDLAGDVCLIVPAGHSPVGVP
jgi:hypothetical protein